MDTPLQLNHLHQINHLSLFPAPRPARRLAFKVFNQGLYVRLECLLYVLVLEPAIVQ